jgi:hypothetical protein
VVKNPNEKVPQDAKTNPMEWWPLWSVSQNCTLK